MNLSQMVRVTTADQFPHSCVCCALNNGPHAAVREHPHLGMIYVCADCWEEIGVALGTLDGKQRDVVLDNTQALAARDTEIAKQARRISKLDGQAKDWQALAEERALVLDDQRQRIEQLEGAISAEAQSKLAVLAASS